jgi:hypothetical protein
MPNAVGSNLLQQRHPHFLVQQVREDDVTSSGAGGRWRQTNSYSLTEWLLPTHTMFHGASQMTIRRDLETNRTTQQSPTTRKKPNALSQAAPPSTRLEMMTHKCHTLPPPGDCTFCFASWDALIVFNNHSMASTGSVLSTLFKICSSITSAKL